MIKALAFIIVAYAQGLWFLISSPNQFIKFMKVYRRHAVSLEAKESIEDTGYFKLPRHERRRIMRAARKSAHNQMHKGEP